MFPFIFHQGYNISDDKIRNMVNEGVMISSGTHFHQILDFKGFKNI